MSSRDRSTAAVWRARAVRVILLALAGAIGLFALVLGGVDLAAWLARSRSQTELNRLSDVGQAFGAPSALFSGLALIALVVTAFLQLRELKSQQIELGLQRRALVMSQQALSRSAEADLRRLHNDLIVKAIDDPILAEVWPSYPGWSEQRRRQYLYMNLVMQNTWLQAKLRMLTDPEIEAAIRHLFKSPLFREYWEVTNSPRSALLFSGTESKFYEMADRICREYQAVVDGSGTGGPDPK